MRLNVWTKFFILLGAAALSTEIAPTGGGAVGDAHIKPPHGVRDKLTVQDLLNGNFQELVHNDYFMPIGDTGPPIHRLSGVPEPATEFRYASTNTFAVSYVLNQYVKAREGAKADFWLMVEDNVLKPLGILHLPLARTQENDGKLGVPIMGWGSYPNVIEAAKIGRLLHDEGLSGGKQLLNKNKVKESLHRTSRIGYAAGMSYGNPEAYLHSMWIPQVRLSTCFVTAPSMTGAGGNRVVVLPSGVTAIRFGDSNQYDITCMVAVAELYHCACPGRR